MFVESADGQGQLILADLDDQPRVVANAPHGSEALAVPPFVGVSPVTPCERVFLAYAAPPAIWWVDPCDANGAWSEQASGELSELPSSASLSGAATADLDGDGGTDLVASTAAGSSMKERFARSSVETGKPSCLSVAASSAMVRA